MFTIAICDDNQDFINHELSIVSEYLTTKKIEHQIRTFDTGLSLLKDKSINTYDLILLDYEMEGLTGFETAEIIRKKNDKTCIAFVTVFLEFAREGYKFDAIRYLVKTETTFKNELIDCIDKALHIHNEHINNIKTIEFVERTLTIDISNIVFIKAEGHYLVFHILENCNMKCYKKRDKMQNILNILSDNDTFAIIRKGLLINMKYIRSFDKKGIITLLAENKTNVFIISDSNKDRFTRAYMNYLSK